MKSILAKGLLFIVISCLSFSRLNASSQAPDYLIIEKDTFEIYSLPAYSLDSARQSKFFKNLQLDKPRDLALNLFRGFQAFWRIQDDKLYLAGVKGYKNSDSILKMSFPLEYEEGKVFADWYSSTLVIPKGKLLRSYGDLSTTWFKEKIFEFRNGIITNSKIINNYIDLKNGISRLKRKPITDTIFSKISQLNWNKISDCGIVGDYFITINEKGKIGNIQHISFLDTEKEIKEDSIDHIICIRQFKKKLKSLQFDIITKHGKPYQETIRLEILYNVDGKLENNSYAGDE
jgi:hypothetical protein